MRSKLGFRLILASVAMLPVGSLFAQDTAGKAAFAQCSVCHSTDGSNGVGPSLKGVIGRKAGEFAGFRFSRALKASGLVWDENSLDLYLTDPQKAVPGNVMPFAGLADPKLRAALIAYLASLK
jgi:cytochrome c